MARLLLVGQRRSRVARGTTHSAPQPGKEPPEMSLLANMPTGIAAVFWGVVTFSVLVLLHEGGHFLAARAFGVKVHVFMLRLPGPALRRRSKRICISYGVTAIPLGVYVRIAVMEPGREDAL